MVKLLSTATEFDLDSGPLASDHQNLLWTAETFDIVAKVVSKEILIKAQYFKQQLFEKPNISSQNFSAKAFLSCWQHSSSGEK